MLPAKQQQPDAPAHYAAKAVYDGKRTLTPAQHARAKETVRLSKDLQARYEATQPKSA
jgi:hypothetical protein